MNTNRTGSLRAFALFGLAGILLILSQASVSADKKPKSYPEAGKVTGRGTTAHTRGQGTVYSQTYKIETAKVIWLLDCGKLPFMSGTGGECGGEKKIQIGDVLHFRIEKDYAYIAAPDLSGAAGSEEEKLRIISQDLKPDAAPDKPAASQR